MLPFILSLSLIGSTFARQNDWSLPCHSGSCFWDLPAKPNGASGSLRITGSSLALADITPSAGWSIIDCHPSATEQTILITCANSSASCSHLLQTDPTNRIVRLTEECGGAPFGRIVNMSVASQDAPAKRGLKRATSSVYALTFDTDFSAGDNPHGPVNFSVSASSSPSMSASKRSTPALHRRHRGSRFFVHENKHIMKRAFAPRVPELTERGFGDVDINKTSAPASVSVTKSGNLFSQSLDCGPFDASVSVDVDVDADAQATVGIVISGGLFPPKIKEAAITAGLSANINGMLRINASADGGFSTPSVTLFQAPLPGGIDVPGIFTLGPSFQVIANADVELGVGLNTEVGLAYSVQDAYLVFPPSQGSSSGQFNPIGNTPLHISTETDLAGHASITGHLIPELVLGLNAFSGKVQTDITLSLDASATISVNGTLDASSSGSQTTGSACVDVSSALNVNAGADADLFNIFNKGASVNLFSKSFDLFEKCIASESPSTSASSPPSVPVPSSVALPAKSTSPLTQGSASAPVLVSSSATDENSYMATPAIPARAPTLINTRTTPKPRVTSSPRHVPKYHKSYLPVTTTDRDRLNTLEKRVDITCPSVASVLNSILP